MLLLPAMSSWQGMGSDAAARSAGNAAVIVVVLIF